MQRRFLRMRDLARVPGREDAPGRYGVCAATIWRWVQRGEFPTPVKLAAGTTAWPADAVEQWEREKGYTPNSSTAKATAASLAKRAERAREGA